MYPADQLSNNTC